MAKLRKSFKKRVTEDSKVMSVMVLLLKQSPSAMHKLQDLRINPQLNKVLAARDTKVSPQHVKLRCDLEFYIPQLIAQYLRSDLKPSETAKLRDFLLECSRLSLFFAHRVYWYLKASSLVDTDSEEGQH